MDGLKGPKIDISLHGKEEERHSLIRVSRKLPRNCDTGKDTGENAVLMTRVCDVTCRQDFGSGESY